MKNLITLLILGLCFVILTSEDGCNAPQPISTSGAMKATTQVQTDLNGHTIEQNNIMQRLAVDNKPGSIKHLYIISAYSGQVLLYSTVKGKVTSSGKRLSPNSLADSSDGFEVDFGDGRRHWTKEILGDDGTYGNSVDYIYWWDSKGIYHQQYITGGMMVHVSDQHLGIRIHRTESIVQRPISTIQFSDGEIQLQIL